MLSLYAGPVSVLYIFYRFMTLLFDGVRFSLIYKTVRIFLRIFVSFSLYCFQFAFFDPARKSIYNNFPKIH